MVKHRQFTPEYKAWIVLKTLTEGKSLSQASWKHGIKDSVLSRWEKEFIERSPMLFKNGSSKDARDERIAELERMVGLQVHDLEMRKKVTNFLDSQ